MSTMLSIHYVTDISAHRHDYPHAPMNISIKGDGRTPHDITLYFDDSVLIGRLVEAINKVARERREELAAAERAFDDEETANG